MKGGLAGIGALLRAKRNQWLILISCMTLTACFENPERPALTTLPREEIPGVGYMTVGVITSDGGSEIIEKGICFGNSPEPDILASKMVVVGDGNEFAAVAPISPGTTVYIRAYAINGAGIGYGNTVQYSSIEVNLQYIDQITGTTAMCFGLVNSDQTVTSRGVCWSTLDLPTINDSKVDVGGGSGTFTAPMTGLSNGTQYYVRPYAVGPGGVFYGNTLSMVTAAKPTVTTKTINNPNTFIPNSGGIVTNPGGMPITNMGLCWSKDPAPTIDDFKGAFKKEAANVFNNNYIIELESLQPSTTYYVRAYAINEVGIGYGNELSFTTPAAAVTDHDGNFYSAVTIGSQVWTVENLETTHYSNGDVIAHLTDRMEWLNTNSGAWDYYASDNSFNQPYGKLYNWFAVTDPRNVCPTGWHVPSDSEWSTLINFLGGMDAASVKLQEAGQVHWSMNGAGTNTSGFTALPGGSVSGDFYSNPIGISGLFWSVTVNDGSTAWGYHLTSNLTSVIRFPYVYRYGLSVRCLKN